MPVTHPTSARRALGHVTITGLTAALVLFGCDAPDPKPTVTSTTSRASTSSSMPAPSSSSSSTAQPLIIPDPAKKHTDAGAEAFARFFVTALGHAQVSTDASTIRAVSLKSCTYCLGFADEVDANMRRGTHQDIDRSRILRTSFRGYDKKDRPVIDVYVREPGASIVDKTGAKVRSFPSMDYRIRLRLLWTGGGWKAQAGAVS